MTNNTSLPKVNFDDVLDDDYSTTNEIGVSNKKYVEAAYKYAEENNYYTQINSEKPSQLKNVLIQLPEDLVQQLNIYQAENNVTRKYVVMKALKDMGFKIRNIDLAKDGRSRK